VFANGMTIAFGGFIGIILGEKLRSNSGENLLKILGIFIIVLGLQSTLQMEHILRTLVYLILGTLIGEVIGIEKYITSHVLKIEQRGNKSNDNNVTGFITASIIYCVGSLSIIASVKAGVLGDCSLLYTKAVLDGVVAVVLATTMGIGVVYSSFVVIMYQGSITMFSSLLKEFMTTDLIHDLDSVGGILIICIGLKILKALDIQTGNLLPVILMPFVYHIIV